MTRTFARLAAAAAVLCLASPVMAKCSDDIKALEGKAAGTDANNKPGQQTQTGNDKTTADHTSGGTKSASEFILKAKAFDEKGDEANCVKAIGEAKQATGSQ